MGASLELVANLRAKWRNVPEFAQGSDFQEWLRLEKSDSAALLGMAQDYGTAADTCRQIARYVAEGRIGVDLNSVEEHLITLTGDQELLETLERTGLVTRARCESDDPYDPEMLEEGLDYLRVNNPEVYNQLLKKLKNQK